MHVYVRTNGKGKIMAVKDYYKILGVEKSATQDEIKSAYRKLAKQYHPDLHPGDNAAAEKFKEINEAYSVVGDADKRAKYDRGEMDDQGNFGSGFNPFGGQGGYTAGGFDDLFNIFSGAFNFGGGNGSNRRRGASTTGTDVQVNIELTFMEAVLGCKKTIKFSRVEKCKTCNGTGAKDDSCVKTCDKCNGTGTIRQSYTSIFGQQTTIGACDKCGGTGKIVTEPCKACGGKGVTTVSRTIDIGIPAGVEDGSVLQLRGEGNAAKGAATNGNLLLVISVRPSKLFKRDGMDLYVTVPVTFQTAVCGGEVEIPSPDGVFIHKLSEGTANGETYRFRGKGVKGTRGIGAGDLYATFEVEVPKAATKAQRKALEEFERDVSSKTYPKRNAYLDEVANLYKNNTKK